MFSALKNENDKLKSWRLSHAGNDMDVSGRSHGVGGFTPHPTAVRSLHHGAAAPDHLMPNSLMRGSSSLGQHHVPPPAPPGRISDRQFSPGDGLGGRPSSAFGLRGSQQVSPAAGIPSFETHQFQNQLAHLGSQGHHTRELGRPHPASQRGRGVGAGKLSSSVLSLGAKQSPANSNELFGRR